MWKFLFPKSMGGFKGYALAFTEFLVAIVVMLLVFHFLGMRF